MKKTLNAFCVLQILYCLAAALVIICMLLYSEFYPTSFGSICFEVGAITNLLVALNPIGLICGVGNIITYIKETCRTKKKNIKFLSWVIIGPILTTAFWLLSIYFFVTYSGGV